MHFLYLILEFSITTSKTVSRIRQTPLFKVAELLFYQSWSYNLAEAYYYYFLFALTFKP